MITAVLVDDIRPALRELEFLLKKHPDISIAGMYTDPLKAIEKIGELKPQAVFLDINMPLLRGIDAGSRILDLSPETDIVFVTAYDQYAVEAFELNALDYLLKPISEDRLEKTVARLRQKSAFNIREKQSLKLQIRCFGRFWMGWEGQEPVKWRIEKAKEIFAFLLQNHGRNISRDELLDRLWPDDNTDRAVKQLYNGIYYIRKALENYAIGRDLINLDHCYNLRLGPVDWDVRRFCELLTKQPANRYENLEEMEALYTDDYLAGEFYSWSDNETNRLANLFEQGVIMLSKKYLHEQEYDKAEGVLLKAYAKNPYSEKITELLLGLYMETDRKVSAARHFKAYSALLVKELGIVPDQRLYALIRA